MVKRLALFILLLWGTLVYAQQDSLFKYRGMLKGSATLAPGFMMAQTQTNIYVHGHLEYFPEEKVSLRGEGFWFTGAQQKPALLKENSSFLFGGLYHFHKNRFDYFIGLQTGMAFTQPSDTVDVSIPTTGMTLRIKKTFEMKATPIISPFTGITFYPGKYVNFFLEVRYINNKYFGHLYGKTLNMDELRISAGLGFQLP